MDEKPKRTWRRWFQFRVSNWLLIVIIVALILSWQHDREQLKDYHALVQEALLRRGDEWKAEAIAAKEALNRMDRKSALPNLDEIRQTVDKEIKSRSVR